MADWIRQDDYNYSEERWKAMDDLANYLRQVRQHFGLSRHEMVDRLRNCGVPVTIQTVYFVEQGDFENQLRLAIERVAFQEERGCELRKLV